MNQSSLWSSVSTQYRRIAGVFLVFCLLVIPAVGSFLFSRQLAGTGQKGFVVDRTHPRRDEAVDAMARLGPVVVPTATAALLVHLGPRPGGIILLQRIVYFLIITAMLFTLINGVLMRWVLEFYG